jgi:RimJ/RimL family protein N-acetyltransferase
VTDPPIRSGAPIAYDWRGAFTNAEVNELHAEAFETRVFTDDEWDWRRLTAAHSLGWVTARRDGDLVGFVNVVWDGLVHAWLQDTMVARRARGEGVGTDLVATARDHAAAAGCEWLHVDFDDDLRSFYVDACGFRPTAAGLLALHRDDDRPDVSPPAVAGRTARLQIEPLDLVHARGLFEALDHPQVGAFIGGPDVTTLVRLRERIVAVRRGPDNEGEQWLHWAVLADGVVVGRVEATLHDGLAEVAYVFGPPWWGRGYATEATQWMVDHLADHYGIATSWATVHPDNAASAALLGRVGFRPAEPGTVSLYSYDDGDLVFVRTHPPT